MKLEVTPKNVYLNRRAYLKSSAALLGISAIKHLSAQGATAPVATEKSLVTGYNNYYEFTTNKSMVKHLAKEFPTSPWDLQVSGLVEHPLRLTLKDMENFEEVRRIYSLRCVEGWSAVIPWQGIPLNSILKLAKPLAKAKFVKFIGTYQPEHMIAQRRESFPWPYTEGLRLDEANHSLTILATGMYGSNLTKQNGAPLRLIVPWKYGYKSIKAIKRIELVSEQPLTSWSKVAPSEYGFYGNVNPNIPHPRWSQRFEVPLGKIKKQKTKHLNGYAGQLEALYINDDINALW